MSLPFKTHLKKKRTYKGGKSRPSSNGKTIHKLSSNENQLGASPKGIAAVNQYLDYVSEYPDRNDIRFRTALSDFHKGIMSPKQFITFNGGVSGIELIIRGFMEPDSECIFSSPGFRPYSAFPSNECGRSINVPLIGDDFQLDVKGIIAAITPKTRLIFVGAPNNPTGSCPTKAQMDELIEALPAHAILVYDEVYYHYVEQVDFIRAYEYVKKGHNVIGLNSFSKVYGLAGMRIGYAYASEEIAQYLHEMRAPFLVNVLSKEAAIAALEDEGFVQKSVALVHKGKAFLYQELDRLAYHYWKTEANFILIDPKCSAKEFEAKMLEEGIMVRPVGSSGHHGIRITIGTEEQNKAVIAALEKLQQF